MLLFWHCISVKLLNATLLAYNKEQFLLAPIFLNNEMEWNRSYCFEVMGCGKLVQVRPYWLCSPFLIQIKADVETQGEFVNSLIREVNNAVYQNIEDVVAFVKWLDDELCFLVSWSLSWPENHFNLSVQYNFIYCSIELNNEDTKHVNNAW